MEVIEALPKALVCPDFVENTDKSLYTCSSEPKNPQVNGTEWTAAGPQQQNREKQNCDEASGGKRNLEGPPGEDDVVCDSCIESPRRARKSCLTCLVSYCEDHLRPHLEKEKFQSHRLVEPLKDVERRVCENHQLPLELYCCVDDCCACHQCVCEQHQDHETLTITEARRRIEKVLQDKQTETERKMCSAETSVLVLQSEVQCVEACVKEVRAVLQEQVNMLQVVVQQVGSDLSKTVASEQKRILDEVKRSRFHMEQHCAELKRKHTHLQNLSKNKHDLQFLQEYSEWKKISTDVPLPVVCMKLTDGLRALGQTVCKITEGACSTLMSAYSSTLQEIRSTDDTPTPESDDLLSNAQEKVLITEPGMREDFLKYGSVLNFDAHTVHTFLRVTADGKKLTNTTPWQHAYPAHPERFEHFKQALAEQSFSSGRHYFEADLHGAGVHVGVAYSGISRCGEGHEACLTGSSSSWCIEWTGRGFSAWHGGVETPLSALKATRVGVYMNFDRSSVAFYTIRGEGEMELLHRYNIQLSEPLHPAVFLPKKENMVLLQPGEDLPPSSPSTPCSPP